MGKRLRKKHTALLPTTQAVVRRLGVYPRLSQNGLGMRIMCSVCSNARHHHVTYRSFNMSGNLLNHARNLEARFFDNIARLRLHLARKHLEQGAFAATVAADQTNPVAGLDIKAHVIKQWSVRPDAQK